MITAAAIDCGTNSIRLLVVRKGAGGVVELARETRLARLGQGVDATGEFHPEALERANAIFEEYAAIIAQHGAERVRLVATSAARDVTNRAVFEANVEERLGIRPDVISGDEEAFLSATGVLSGVTAESPVLVFDIGGGSTELIVIEDGPTIVSAVSLDIGAVRVNERFLKSDPATPDEVAEARAYVGGLLDGTGIDFGQIRTTIGVAGTSTSMAASHLGLQSYQRKAVHRTLLTREDIVRISGRWIRQSVEETLAEPCMHPLRASVLGAGSLIFDEISARVPGGDVMVSESDILDGIALKMLSS